MGFGCHEHVHDDIVLMFLFFKTCGSVVFVHDSLSKEYVINTIGFGFTHCVENMSQQAGL